MRNLRSQKKKTFWCGLRATHTKDTHTPTQLLIYLILFVFFYFTNRQSRTNLRFKSGEPKFMSTLNTMPTPFFFLKSYY